MTVWSVYRIGLGKNAPLQKVGEWKSRREATKQRDLARIGESDQFILYRNDKFVNACGGTGKK